MTRTRMSLSKDEYSAAKAEAKRVDISLTELLRRALRRMVAAAVRCNAWPSSMR
jgi:hypothetical protein